MLLIVVKYTYYLGIKGVYIYMCVCVCVCARARVCVRVCIKQLVSAVPRKCGCVHMKKFLANFLEMVGFS